MIFLNGETWYYFPYPAADGGGSIFQEEAGPEPMLAGCRDAGALVAGGVVPWPESLVGETVGVSFPSLVSRGDAIPRGRGWRFNLKGRN